MADVAQAVKNGARAVVILDQAGWHGAKDIAALDNVARRPPLSWPPELDPVEIIRPVI